jgi:hypothetical protein
VPAASLSKSREQWPTTTIHARLSREGSEGEFSSCFNFFPAIQILSHHFSVKLLFSQLRPLPSLPQSRELGPATTIPAHLLHGEGDDGEFSSCFYFFSTIPIYFSQPLFPVKLLFNGSHVLLIFIFIPCPSSQF